MKRERSKKKLVVVGLGYVGLPLALLADKKGYKVTGIDVDEEKVEKINSRIAPFGDQDVARDLRRSHMKADSDFSIVKNATTVVICVPTPVFADHTPNLEPVKKATEGIAPFLQEDTLVILESTVNPGEPRQLFSQFLRNFLV